MQTIPASHGSVAIGLLPLMTVIFAVVYLRLQGGIEVHIGDIYLVTASFFLWAFGCVISG